MDGATVRPAEARDYEGLCALFDELDAFHAAQVPWLFVKPDGPARSREYFEPFYVGKDAAGFVADAGASGVVGAALGIMRTTADFPVMRRARYGVLDVLGVRESFWRRGIATELTRAVEAWAVNGGAEWIELGVYEFNEGARLFYEALGYGTVSRKMRKPCVE